MSDAEYMARVEAMERKLYRVARAVLWNDHDCADAIQEAVFKGWMKRDSLRESSFFETWLVRILINECRNIQRRQKLKLLPLDEGIRTESITEELVESIELRDALKALPEKYRMPLLLHYLEGYDLSEVAQILGLTVQLTKSRLHQARSALRKLVTEEEKP